MAVSRDLLPEARWWLLLTTDPVPFDWYCALVLEGAREHGLPEAYVAELASQRCKRDPRRAR